MGWLCQVRLALQQPKFPSPKPYAEILYRIVSRLQFRETQQEKIKYMQSIVDRSVSKQMLGLLSLISDDSKLSRSDFAELWSSC